MFDSLPKKTALTKLTNHSIRIEILIFFEKKKQNLIRKQQTVNR